jgi:hypothetical protein
LCGRGTEVDVCLSGAAQDVLPRGGVKVMMVALSLGAKSPVLVKGELDALRATKRREMQESYEGGGQMRAVARV